ncbi:MAG: hypothetical protein ABI655_04420 [Phenylobacterium sp.]
MSRKARRQAYRKALKAALKARFVPYLITLGFESTRKNATKAAWSELNRWEYDYGRRRDSRVDFLSLHWERYGAPWFEINFGTCEVTEIVPGSLPASWRSGEIRSGFYPFPWGLVGWGGHWFGQHRDPNLAVDLAICRMAELDEFFRSGREGEHVVIRQTSRGATVINPLPLPLKLVFVALAPLGWLAWLVEKLIAGVRGLRSSQAGPTGDRNEGS